MCRAFLPSPCGLILITFQFIKMNIGTKVWFPEEVKPYTVKAKSERFAILTKPFNLQQTVMYTIVDLAEKIRGTNFWVFNPYDYTNQKDIELCLKELESGECEISQRNRVHLSIAKIL